jgi:glycosyltransferase involved in cell wall biosynthesis
LKTPRFSIIVPVYNRPQEVRELLDSLRSQTCKDFEVIIVEDGSTMRCEQVVDEYRSHYSIQYIFKQNSGPGTSRNVGYKHARGEYFVVFDSDCIIPSTYLDAVNSAIQDHHWDAWGGPDRGHEQFTVMQRAMGYTMASVLTTGGIRGGKKHVGWFQPRSFNMGISKETFLLTKGFQFDRFAEDIEFSIRMKNAGLKVGLIPEAFVYHKRRTNFRQFFKQVFNFGKGRVLVGNKYPSEVKLTHWFPSFFFLACVCWLFAIICCMPIFWLGSLLLGIYLLAILIHATLTTKNIWVGLLSVPSAIIQLCGYGLGFLTERFLRRI